MKSVGDHHKSQKHQLKPQAQEVYCRCQKKTLRLGAVALGALLAPPVGPAPLPLLAAPVKEPLAAVGVQVVGQLWEAGEQPAPQQEARAVAAVEEYPSQAKSHQAPGVSLKNPANYLPSREMAG
jgi:hypothetical protein